MSKNVRGFGDSEIYVSDESVTSVHGLKRESPVGGVRVLFTKRETLPF